METSAVIMMIFAIVVLWGGAAYTISIALKSKK